MVEPQINLWAFYTGWDAYQTLLVKAIAPLSSDQLALRVAPHLRSVGENVAHIISGRVSNFLVLGAAGPDIAPLEKWDVDDAPPRSAAELVNGLEASCQMIQTALIHWTPADLQDVFVDGQGEQAPRLTRQWIIWSTIKHDLHHSGEVSLTLGTHQLDGLDL